MDECGGFLQRSVMRLATFPLRALIRLSGNAEVVLYDVERWAVCLERSDLLAAPRWSAFAGLVFAYPEFRSLVHHRIRSLALPLRAAARLFWPGESSLRLAVPIIGRGLFIQHGFATIVAATSIGEDCWINQQVTVGFRGAAQPTIGNRVQIGAGAVVIGGVVIGDDVKVGANATVVRSVPAGETVVSPEAVTLASARALREPMISPDAGGSFGVRASGSVPDGGATPRQVTG